VEYFLLYLWLFYIAFVVYAGCQTAIKDRKWIALIPCLPIIIIGGIMDIAFNQTFGYLIFWEKEYTLTFSERLDSHFTDSGWRGKLARGLGAVLDEILPGHIS
jgi:hypothetical protein